MLIQFPGVLGVALGCYLLLGLAVPGLRHWSWRNDPAGVVASFAAFSILLGLSGLGVARPYTWIAALGALAMGYIILCRNRTELLALVRPLLEKRRAVIALFLMSFVAFLACWFLA